MKILLLMVGKTRFPFVRSGMDEYLKRMGRYVSMELRYIADVRSSARMDAAIVKGREGEAILRVLGERDVLVLLDEKGTQMTSGDFARFVEQRQRGGSGHLVFLIGGAHGFSGEVYNRADYVVSLSRMTFAHQLVRVIFMEQLYRAFTIINNEPYHLRH